jgi:hypothetical protein
VEALLIHLDTHVSSDGCEFKIDKAMPLIHEVPACQCHNIYGRMPEPTAVKLIALPLEEVSKERAIELGVITNQVHLLQLVEWIDEAAEDILQLVIRIGWRRIAVQLLACDPMPFEDTLRDFNALLRATKEVEVYGVTVYLLDAAADLDDTMRP